MDEVGCELLTSVVTIVAYLFLLAGNLVGAGKIIGFLLGIGSTDGIWLAAGVMWVILLTILLEKQSIQG